ncbi:hypothetical protein HBI56_198850 [Parastagonospora nodorum]|uniref:RING-type E3 ubiquitin transferase n=2 Tax=Phaeosphaeria nodorum (strain SN15 / ATCC MYA-4574 / FGSC 10173) TaxID=321614 RepID=A0A7U2I394_PHANO|nr:hypothetical protein HBH56_203900 [Parastagonospora nodorum]QRD01716.1 hypothetical protein JI435_145440 [Parastagonospora nodorum SN15]KAH3923932.1 hypothetical protein HBH54_202770 [Parastagonospora nodorum]KAH3941477.1 hypothetical protein HBH53_201600 [Parastagonospora nodorum]KAH3959571.1 hypothetical protein HBH51_198930 [Parastagonospora nodorum]
MGSTSAPTRDESGDTCVICLSTVTERAITSPCNHYTFDFVCLVSWLQERSTCPLCKVEVTTVQYDWRSPTDYKSYAVRQSHQSAESSRNDRPASLYAPYGLPRRPHGTRRAYSPPVEDTALAKRREVYQHKLYSLHVGSNPLSGYCDLTPQMIASSSDLQSRARMWVRRELRVFSFLDSESSNSSSAAATTSSNAEFLLSYIISILKMVDVKASNGHAESLLADFLGRENSRLFLHELQSWLRSPYKKLEQWDEEVQYNKPFE